MQQRTLASLLFSCRRAWPLSDYQTYAVYRGLLCSSKIGLTPVSFPNSSNKADPVPAIIAYLHRVQQYIARCKALRRPMLKSSWSVYQRRHSQYQFSATFVHKSTRRAYCVFFRLCLSSSGDTATVVHCRRMVRCVCRLLIKLSRLSQHSVLSRTRSTS